MLIKRQYVGALQFVSALGESNLTGAVKGEPEFVDVGTCFPQRVVENGKFPGNFP